MTKKTKRPVAKKTVAKSHTRKPSGTKSSLPKELFVVGKSGKVYGTYKKK